MNRLFSTLVVALGLAQFVFGQKDTSAENSGTLHLIHSSHVHASWLGIATNGQYRFQIGQGEQSIAVDQIIAWQANTSNANLRNEAVVLVDGTILRGLLASLRDDAVRIQSSLFGLVEVPRDRIAAVVLDSREASLLDLYHIWIEDTTESDDVISLRDGQRVQGVLKNLGTGSLLKIDATQAVQIETPMGASLISVSRIAAIRFSPLLNPIHSPLVPAINFTFDDGSHVAAKTVKTTNDEFEFMTDCGVVLKSKSADCIGRCTSIYSNSFDSPNWRYIGQEDVSEVRGQSDWTRKQWLYVTASDGRSQLAPYSPQVVIVPSSRIKLNNDQQWKNIVGTYRQRRLPDRHSTTSDVIGSRAELAAMPETDKLKVRFIAVVDGKLVGLWDNNHVDDTTDTVSFAVDVASQSEVYLLVERPSRFVTPSDTIFEYLRFTK